jgi:hypothetical protein
VADIGCGPGRLVRRPAAAPLSPAGADGRPLLPPPRPGRRPGAAGGLPGQAGRRVLAAIAAAGCRDRFRTRWPEPHPSTVRCTAARPALFRRREQPPRPGRRWVGPVTRGTLHRFLRHVCADDRRPTPPQATGAVASPLSNCPTPASRPVPPTRPTAAWRAGHPPPPRPRRGLPPSPASPARTTRTGRSGSLLYCGYSSFSCWLLVLLRRPCSALPCLRVPSGPSAPSGLTGCPQSSRPRGEQTATRSVRTCY